MKVGGRARQLLGWPGRFGAHLKREIETHGPRAAARDLGVLAAHRAGWYRLRHRAATPYVDPSPTELHRIEDDLASLGVRVEDLVLDVAAFKEFQASLPFPHDYHDGPQGGAWHEKLLEHFIAMTLLDLERFSDTDVYLDIAASGSPWVHILRERRSIAAYALDLRVPPALRSLPYYLEQDAVRTAFPAKSVRGASLQCAYEMFRGEDDRLLVDELARILLPGGKAVVAPLYMHTHYCAYATAEYWGRGLSDPAAIEYIVHDSLGVPSSRKYDARTLKARVLDRAVEAGLDPRLLALRNGAALGPGIYCHFVLVLSRRA